MMDAVFQITDVLAAKEPRRWVDGDPDTVDRTLWRLRLRIEGMGAPPLHIAAAARIGTGSGAWATARHRVAAELASTPNSIVALLGPRGTGKTQMAVSLAVASILADGTRRFTARYIRAADLFRQIRAAMRGDGEDKLVREVSGSGLLIIDEAHERSGTEFEDRTLVNILDARYGGLRPTILISNQMRDAFSDSMGPSVCSRMCECGSVVECCWPSFRVQRTGGRAELWRSASLRNQ